MNKGKVCDIPCQKELPAVISGICKLWCHSGIAENCRLYLCNSLVSDKTFNETLSCTPL